MGFAAIVLIALPSRTADAQSGDAKPVFDVASIKASEPQN
jgi:hypothetical protein